MTNANGIPKLDAIGNSSLWGGATAKHSTFKVLQIASRCFNHCWRYGLFSYVFYAAFFVPFGNSGIISLQFGKQLLSTCIEQNGAALDESVVRFIAVTIVSMACLLSYFSSRVGRSLNQLFAMVKILLLVSVIGLGVYTLETSQSPQKRATEDRKSYQNVPAALLLVLYSFQGWENATYVSFVDKLISSLFIPNLFPMDFRSRARYLETAGQ
jgi:amino acid transporter